MAIPYSLSFFYELLDELSSTKKFVKVKDVLEDGIDDMNNAVLIRFDVERDPAHTLEIAKVLAQKEVFATFYFHSRPGVYDHRVMIEMQDLGHELGYHHECLDRAHGQAAEAREIFEKDVAMFRRDGIDLQTVCQHSEVGFHKNGYVSNADLFRRHPDLLTSLSLLGEVYIDLNLRWGEVYVSDTFKGIMKFDSMLKNLKSNTGFNGILIHPHRWRESPMNSFKESGSDMLSMFRRKLAGSSN